MKSFSCYTIILLLVHTAILPADEMASAENNILEYPNNQNFLSLRRNQGQSLGSTTSYTTIEALTFPFYNANVLPFLDFRLHAVDKADSYATNIGGGLRIQSNCSNLIFGANAFYDYRKAHRFNYNQIGMGFEILGTCWSFRLNGYLPVGNTKAHSSCCLYDEYIGDYFVRKEGFTDSLKGVDFEIESLLAETCWADLYMGIGSYYYSTKGCQKNVFGSQYRFSADFCNYFNFSIIGTYDCVFKSRVQAQIGVTIPFYFHCGNEAVYCRAIGNPRLFQPVRRQDLIILKKRHRWTWNF